MAMSEATSKEHWNDPAVLCCRTEAGTILACGHLEDPAIFPDLEDSGLLTLPDNCLKVGEVLGATLTKTLDALIPVTPDSVEGVQKLEGAEPAAESVAEPVAPKEEVVAVTAMPAEMPVVAPQGCGNVHIHIAEGRGIDFHVTLSGGGYAGAAPVAAAGAPAAVAGVPAAVAEAPLAEPKVIRSLTRKHFKIDEVLLGDETKIEGTTLTIRKDICKDAMEISDLVTDLSLEIITPADYGKYSETIMDVQPIATKEGDSKLGSGVTRVLDGVVFVVTGTDEGGVQIGEFGSSEGEMDRNIMWGRPGAPDKGEIFIKTKVVIKEKTNMERPGPLAAHKASDVIAQEIRNVLKTLDESLVVDTEELKQYRRPGRKKVVVIKEIMGQGAMHDNLILPEEPVGIIGGKPNIDLGNLPVMLSPLEILDGGIHALTCIGPASKEMSRHYWREPLVLEVLADDELDLAGVMLVGSPQINSEKFYVSERLGMAVEAMDVDGAFITTEGFGNNHIDFASHHEQVGMRDVPVVGMSFCAVQGALVVGNKYMSSMVDNNKSMQGIENEILANNTLCKEDAVRAVAMLKSVMGGAPVKTAERHYNVSVKEMNLDAIEEQSGVTVDLVPNEQVLPKSKKRQEIYEKED